MKNDMKLIMESWRESPLQEQNQPIQNVGQMRGVINKFRQMKAGKEVGKGFVEFGLEQTPIVNNLYSIFKATKTAKDQLSVLAGRPDDAKTNTGMDKLNMNDQVSKIVDDRLEQAFLNWLLNHLDQLNDSDPIPDADEKLKQWLATNFSNHYVASA